MGYFTLPNILILFAVVFILYLLTEVKSYKSKNIENKKEKLEEIEEVFSNTLPEKKKIEIKEIKYEEIDKEKEKRKAQEELMNLRLKMMEEKTLEEASKEIKLDKKMPEELVRIPEIHSPEIISIKKETVPVISSEVKEKSYKTIEEKDEEKLEQEEMDAIISITELETKGQKLYDSLDKEPLDEEEIPISIEELYETMELPTVNVKKIEKIEEEQEKRKVEEKALYDLKETKE